MNKVLVRVLLFFIVLPLLLVVAMWDWAGHFPLVVLGVVISALGAAETASLLRSKGLVLNPYLPYALGVFFPVLAYLETLKILDADQSMTISALVIVAILIRQIFANTEENLEPVLGKVAGILFSLIYPGLFIYFILKLNTLPGPNTWLFMPIFMMATFGNDAWAWLFGSLFGRKSPKPFIVSPSKSLIGFAGGISATFLVFIVCFFWFPGLLGTNLWMILGLSLIFSLTTIVGDLFESSLKRSAGVKDSGTIIPGRGGVLDSIDSLLFSAPIFYLFLQYGRF